MTLHHVGVRVIPEADRDTFHSAGPSEQDSYEPISSEGQPPVGEDHEYAVELSEETAERFRAASNAHYVIAAEEVRAHQVVLEEASTSTFPDPEEMRWHGAEGIEEAGYDGEGVIHVNADTGLSASAERRYAGRIVGRRDYTGKGSTEDGNGHGSMTSSLQVSAKAELYICKVLGDNGSGSSTGIVKSMYLCGELAEANPGKVVIGNYSLGGSSFERFEPYVRAVRTAREKGALILASAGNDGKYGVAAPGNTEEGMASIAFGAGDRRASFSNHHESAGCAAIGYRALVMDRDNRPVRANGTSFSCPWWVRLVGDLATPKQRLGDVFGVHRAILANCRDTPEPAREEAAGAVNARAAIDKLAPKKPEPSPEPEPEPKPEPRPEPEPPAPKPEPGTVSVWVIQDDDARFGGSISVDGEKSKLSGSGTQDRTLDVKTPADGGSEVMVSVSRETAGEIEVEIEGATNTVKKSFSGPAGHEVRATWTNRPHKPAPPKIPDLLERLRRRLRELFG